MTTIVLVRKNNEVVVAGDGQVSMGNTVVKSTASKVRKIEKRDVVAGFAKVLNLGPADFGQYKNILFILFLVTAIGSIYYVPDFLAVRGLAAMILLTAGLLLDASYMHYGSALILKSFVYFAIVVALILGANPYKLRDFFDWLYKSSSRPRAMGEAFAAYGLLLIGVAFTS